MADSRRARLVIPDTHPITYAFPEEDVRSGLLGEPGAPRDHPQLGRIREADLEVDGERRAGAARFFDAGPAADAGLQGYVALDWDKMDAWYEEDEEVYVHPHDPNHRIDVLRSRRHVVIEKDGEVLAKTHHPTLLFETHLPVRYYIPHTDVRMEVLRPSETSTGCAYKGFANYYHVKVAGALHEDLVWTYRSPHQGALPIQGLLCFFDERVDVQVDGERQQRPKTPWSG